MEIRVKEASPLMEFLLREFHGKSRTAVKAMLAKKLVLVDGAVVTRFDHMLAPGATVAIGKKSPAEPVSLNGVKIIYEDDAVIVIEKAAGLLSVATDSGVERNAHGIVTDFIRRQTPKTKVLIVHRLDRDTSGVMMFVKEKDLQRQLRQNWRESIETRRYAAVVEGVVAKDRDTIVSWLHGTDTLRTYSGDKEGGQKAVSHYEVLKRSAGYSLVEVELETGRKNQIRVHMSDLGHPVAGDTKYGAKGDPLRRLGLHAKVLAFTHPVSGKEMSFEAETPPEFLRLFGVNSPKRP